MENCRHRFVQSYNDGEDQPGLVYIDYYCHECKQWLIFDEHHPNYLSYWDYDTDEEQIILQWLKGHPDDDELNDEVILGKSQ